MQVANECKVGHLFWFYNMCKVGEGGMEGAKTRTEPSHKCQLASKLKLANKIIGAKRCEVASNKCR